MKTASLRIFALVALPCFANAASFTPLGNLAGGFVASDATGVSDDGSVVVGNANRQISSQVFHLEAFRWTSSSGMVGLGDLPGGDFESFALGVSADGNVVVGSSVSTNGQEAYRWTTSDGMVGLGDLPGGSFSSQARAVSADGSVVVGYSQSALGEEAFRWTSVGGMFGLGDLHGDQFGSIAYGVSADGSVVVGVAYPPTGVGGAFRWTSSGGMVSIGDLPGGSDSSTAYGVSADGTVAVGYGLPEVGDSQATRWSNGDGILTLDPGIFNPYGSAGLAASADGSVIVGRAAIGSTCEPFVWTQASGMQRLTDLLLANGATGLEGWSLCWANAISSNGQWVVGFGTNPDGDQEAFLANIGPPDSGGGDGGDGGGGALDGFSLLALSLMGMMRRKLTA